MASRPPRKREPARTTASPDAQSDPLLGREVARCRLEEYLAGGATAVVYRGTHTGLGIPVAVKILRSKAARVPAIVDGFRQEARAIARLDDENVLKVYDVVDEGSLHCMVMELLEGESVLDMITSHEQLRLIDMLRVMRQAAAGLAAAHAQGILHRDVKPGNLVVLPNGTVKLVDFGLAVEQEATGQRVGTPHYMAPETCATGQSEEASDIYSLGISMYHMLVGQPPYAGKKRDDIIRAHRDGVPMDLNAARPGLVGPILKLFDDLTARDPAQRPTAVELGAELDRIGGKRLSKTRSLRRKSSESVAARVGAGALVLLLAVGAWFLLGRGKSGPGEGAPDDAPRAQVPVVVEPPPPPPPDEPTEEELALEARTEQEAEELLSGVESWARKSWHERSDTPRVVKRYRNISGPYTKTRAGVEAARRVEEIEAGRLHPHPDHAWSPPEQIEAARAALETGGGTIEKLIAAHRYLDAKAALPAQISDPEGTLEARVASEHAYLDALVAFPAGLAARLAAAPSVSREIMTARGEGVLTAVGDSELKVLVGGKKLTLAWGEVEPKVMARLGVRAFEGAPGQDVLPLLAFCVAHGLESTFWEASLGVDLAGRPASEEELVRDLEARLGSR